MSCNNNNLNLTTTTTTIATETVTFEEDWNDKTPKSQLAIHTLLGPTILCNVSRYDMIRIVISYLNQSGFQIDLSTSPTSSSSSSSNASVTSTTTDELDEEDLNIFDDDDEHDDGSGGGSSSGGSDKKRYIKIKKDDFIIAYMYMNQNNWIFIQCIQYHLIIQKLLNHLFSFICIPHKSTYTRYSHDDDATKQDTLFYIQNGLCNHNNVCSTMIHLKSNADNNISIGKALISYHNHNGLNGIGPSIEEFEIAKQYKNQQHINNHEIMLLNFCEYYIYHLFQPILHLNLHQQQNIQLFYSYRDNFDFVPYFYQNSFQDFHHSNIRCHLLCKKLSLLNHQHQQQLQHQHLHQDNMMDCDIEDSIENDNDDIQDKDIIECEQDEEDNNYDSSDNDAELGDDERGSFSDSSHAHFFDDGDGNDIGDSFP